jgi:hypothetical protein
MTVHIGVIRRDCVKRADSCGMPKNNNNATAKMATSNSKRRRLRTGLAVSASSSGGDAGFSAGRVGVFSGPTSDL